MIAKVQAALTTNPGVITKIHQGPITGPGLKTGCTVAICTYKRAKSLRRLLVSLSAQSRRPDEVLIVDASPDAHTENVIREFEDLTQFADTFRYYRVDDSLRGLTRQRNFALDLVGHDLLAWFDDDIVLHKDCLREMEKSHRGGGGQIAGVGAHMQNESRKITFFWRIRRFFRMTPTLQPGRYFRSGMATPWRFLHPTDELVEGDWLTGYAMMWRTELARQVRFNPIFIGYSSGEDLDFSLRMRKYGRLCVAGSAKAEHLHESAGRPNPYQLGRMSLKNSYSIHRRCIPNRTWWDACWFLYGYGTDTALRLLTLLRPGDIANRGKFIAGRLRTMAEILFVGSRD